MLTTVRYAKPKIKRRVTSEAVAYNETWEVEEWSLTAVKASLEGIRQCIKKYRPVKHVLEKLVDQVFSRSLTQNGVRLIAVKTRSFQNKPVFRERRLRANFPPFPATQTSV